MESAIKSIEKHHEIDKSVSWGKKELPKTCHSKMLADFVQPSASVGFLVKFEGQTFNA